MLRPRRWGRVMSLNRTPADLSPAGIGQAARRDAYGRAPVLAAMIAGNRLAAVVYGAHQASARRRGDRRAAAKFGAKVLRAKTFACSLEGQR